MKKYAFFWKALLITTVVSGIFSDVMACEACKAQQHKFLQGVTHGPVPTSNVDYGGVSIMVIIRVYSFYAMVKCLAKPADKGHEHIKNMILNS